MYNIEDFVDHMIILYRSQLL